LARSVTIRKLVAGLGTALIIAVSLLTSGSLPLTGLLRIAISTLGATALYISIALALAIHRSYPARHDKPEDIGKLLTEGPYELCRHPLYFFTMITQISIPLTLASLIGLLVAISLAPAWLLLVKVEERELIDYWGEEYLNYMKRVPALIPDLRKVITRNR